MAIKDLFAGVADVLTLGPARDVREQRKLDLANRRQVVDFNRANHIMATLDGAHQFASQKGDASTKEYADAFDAYATQAGIAPDVAQKFRALEVNSLTQQKNQLTQEIALRKANYDQRLAAPMSPDIEARISKLFAPNEPAPDPRMGALSMENRPGTIQLPPVDPNQANSGMSPREMLMARRRSPAELVAGKVVNPANGRGYGSADLSPAAALKQKPADQPETSKHFAEELAGALPAPPDTQAKIGAMFTEPVPANAVTASRTPRTFKDLGMDTDTAEQFQALESMVGKGLPAGFNLRSDYARDPEFYRQLLLDIRNGVDDPKNPGQKRKLSTQEILDLIMG